MLKVYAAYHNDSITRTNSASGGAFSAIMEAFCDNNYVIFGAAYDENFVVKHSFACSKEDAKRFRGSKYVQSDIGNCYSKAREFLEQDKKVLFTGTPCQIAGLNNFLNKRYPNLLTVDIICYGVPSPAIFKEYLAELQQKYKSKIKEIDFRDKKYGSWQDPYIRIVFESGKEYIKRHCDDPYCSIYFSSIAHRTACNSCPFTSTKRVSDITIADFWGIEKHKPLMPRDKGMSLVIVNTPLGSSVFEIGKQFMIIEKESLEHAVQGNPRLKTPTPPHPFQTQLLEDVNNLSVWKLAQKYCEKRNFMRRIISSCLDHKSRKWLKSFLKLG